MAYVKSKYINVYPTAYRGLSSDSQKVYDPESRMLTEKNVSNIYKNIIDRSFYTNYSKGSYLITDCNNLGELRNAVAVEFILGGYYFKINKNPDNTIWETFSSGTNGYIAIKTAAGVSADDSNTSFENERLINFEDGTVDLDTNDYFKALSFISSPNPPADVTAYLQIVDEEGHVPAVSKFKVHYKNIFAGSESEGLDHFLKTDVINFQDKILCPLGKKDPQLSANEVENIELDAVDLSIRTPELHNKRDYENKGTGKLLIDAPDEIKLETDSHSYIHINPKRIELYEENPNDLMVSGSQMIPASNSVDITQDYSHTGDLSLLTYGKLTLSTDKRADSTSNDPRNIDILSHFGKVNFETAFNDLTKQGDANQILSFTLPYGNLERPEPQKWTGSHDLIKNIIATRDWLDTNIYLDGDKTFKGNITVGQSDSESAKSKNIDLYANILRLGSAYGDLSIPRLKYINKGYTYSEASLDIQDTDVKIYTSKRSNADNSFRIVNKNDISILSVRNEPRVWFGSPGYSFNVPVEMYGALNVHLKDGKGLKVNYDSLTGAVNESSGVVLDNVNFKHYLNSTFEITKNNYSLLKLTSDANSQNCSVNIGTSYLRTPTGSWSSKLTTYFDTIDVKGSQRTSATSHSEQWNSIVNLKNIQNASTNDESLYRKNQIDFTLGNITSHVNSSIYTGKCSEGGFALVTPSSGSAFIRFGSDAGTIIPTLTLGNSSSITGTPWDKFKCYGGTIIGGNLKVGYDPANSGSQTPYGNLYARTGTFTGTSAANEFNATSDIRLKENLVQYIPDKSILTLPVYKYNFINDPKKEQHIGVLAQDLELYCPEIVHKNEEGYLGIEESKIVYLLLEEVKKLDRRIKELENKLN